MHLPTQSDDTLPAGGALSGNSFPVVADWMYRHDAPNRTFVSPQDETSVGVFSLVSKQSSMYY